MEIKKLSGTLIESFSELKKALSPDGQDSGTLEGWVLLNNEKVFVHKHWSYSGGFPFYKTDNIVDNIGEIILNDGVFYCEGENQCLYNKMGLQEDDAELSIKFIEQA